MSNQNFSADLFASRVYQFYKNYKYEIFLFVLLTAGFGLRVLISLKEPYLHEWDERFHALVARNLMHHPLKPMLRANPVDHYDPFGWCCNHIWLHKQPLFMWQMALSMNIFGVSELSLRLPSIVMGSLMILLLYRISFLLTQNKIIALLAATFLAFSHCHLDMISGIRGMDHNDVALGFYVLCSIWAYTEYNRSKKWCWVILIGIFSGCAILNKWLIGLFVYLCWGISILLNIKNVKPGPIIHFGAALLVCCCVFIPWQVYILHNWPVLANYEYDFNRRHITEVLDGHQGSIWYYADYFPTLINVAWPTVFAGIFFSFRKAYKNNYFLQSLLAGLLFVFCFLSFVVKTKVVAHFFFVVPIFLLYMSIGIAEILSYFKKQYWVLPVLFLASYLSLQPWNWLDYFKNQTERLRKIHNTAIYKKIREVLPSNYKIVMNVPSYEDVELMFYHNDITAYQRWLSEEDLKKLGEKRVPVAVFKSHGEYQLPEYIYSYPNLFIIEKELH